MILIHFSIEQSTDAIHFTEVVTAPRDTSDGIAGNYFADSTYYFSHAQIEY